MTRCLRSIPAALALACLACSASADSFTCEPWSAPGYREHGPITIRITETELSWSNGTTVRDAARLAAQVFADSHEVIIVAGSQFPIVRRVPFAPQAPLAVTRCRPIP